MKKDYSTVYGMFIGMGVGMIVALVIKTFMNDVDITGIILTSMGIGMGVGSALGAVFVVYKNKKQEKKSGEGEK